MKPSTPPPPLDGTFGTRVRTVLRESFTALGEPLADAAAYALAHRVHLLLVPVVLGPTAWMFATQPTLAMTPSVVRVVRWVWFPSALSFFIMSAVGVAMGAPEAGTARARWSRALLLIGLVPMVTTNHVSGWIFGTLANPSMAIVLTLVAGYRVFLDYASAVIVATYALVGYVTLGVLELTGAIPSQPLVADPASHPSYAIAEISQVMVGSAFSVIVLGFAVINYGMNQRLKLHRYITRSVLRRYLPESLVEAAARGAFDVDGTPERRTVTVMFTDLVGFTSMSERLGPVAVGDVLNRYLARVSRLAHEHGATVDKFIGDAVMIVIGAPEELPVPEQARRAAALARDIHDAVEALDAGHPLRARSGINTGDAVVGNFGSEVRSDYTVIGPAVNVAARLESASRPGGILVGPETAAHLDEPLDDGGELALKGVSEPVRAWFLRR